MSSSKIIRIGTRGSELALWQANYTQAELAKRGVQSEIIIIKTTGDQIQNIGFDKMEGKGFFTKEIEEKLLAGEVDLAVHSHKDLETTQPDGLCLAATSYRAEMHDLILVRKECADETLQFGFKTGACVGTSSARRKNLLKYWRPDVELKDLRGNVPTRIQKLRDGNYDAIVLAAAGIQRLNIDTTDLYTVIPNMDEFVPAPAQGVLAWQTRIDDQETINAVQQLHNAEVAAAIEAERELMKAIHGGCQVPFGAKCEKVEGGFQLTASYAEKWEHIPAFFQEIGENPEVLKSKATAYFLSKKKS